jgi:hypothetical protein
MFVLRTAFAFLLLSTPLFLRAVGPTNSVITLSAASNATIVSDDSPNPMGDQSILSGTRGPNANGVMDRGLLRFDLASIPAGARIQSVTLRLVVTTVPQVPTPSNFGLFRMLTGWEETATWETAKAGVNWGSPGSQEGVDHVVDASVSEEISDTGEYDFGPGEGLKSDVNGWLAVPDSNKGWLLMSDGEGAFNTARHFGSLASQNPPQLVIEYLLPSTNNPPELKDAQVKGNEFLFSFEPMVGHGYRVEARTSFNVGTWTTVTNLPVATTNSTKVVTNAVEGRQKFFRVVVQ